MPYQKTACALFLVLALCMLPGVAAADCTSPNRAEAAIEYFSADKTYKYCDGTNWIDMSSGICTLALDDLTDVVITSPVDGDALVYDQASGNWFNNTCDNPTGFDFSNANNVNLNTLTNSNIVQVTGLACSATVTISGDGAPQYRTCSDASCSSVLTNWTNGSNSISAGQYIQLRLTSAGTTATTRTADLNIGTGSADWDVTTVLPKIVFVTSQTYTGSEIGGVSGAHSICQARAAAGGLTGTFKAWIASSSGNDPQSTFTQSSLNYQLVNGTVIANGWSDLVDGTIDNLINRDENGNFQGQTYVWTGTNTDGTSTSWHCNAWTSSTGSYSGYRGRTDKTDSGWNSYSTATCSGTADFTLYCFEQ